MLIDPVFTSVLGISFSVLFGLAALGKIRFYKQFQRVLRSYKLFPEAALSATAVLITGMEVIASMSLWLSPLRVSGALMAAILLTSYALGMAINLRRNRRNLDCGCHLGSGQVQPITWFLVSRNLMLSVLVLMLFFSPVDRLLGVYDYLVILMGLGVLGLLYFIVDGLIDNQVLLNSYR